MTTLKDIAESFGGDIHQQGYVYYAVAYQLLSTALQADSDTLADCWYHLGDVHDLNGAPLKAIECYQKAIQFDPSLSSAYREIANMQTHIGDFYSACQNFDQALRLEEDELAQADYDYLLHALKHNQLEVLYTPNDSVWALNEKLANSQFSHIVDLAPTLKTSEEKTCLACAYGALNDNDNYLAIWTEISEHTQTIDMTYRDWFYMPDKVCDTNEMWKIFDRFKTISGVFVFCEDTPPDNKPYDNEKEKHLASIQNEIKFRLSRF